MVLDGCFMITEKDEFLYQEMLSHPAMVSHPDPKNVLIIGGGDGGVARVEYTMQMDLTLRQ